MEKFLVLFGKRKGAIEAALELGYQVVLISDETSKHKEKVQHVLFKFDGAKSQYQEIVQTIQHLPIVAVLACTERAVYPAAKLRNLLGIRGCDTHTAILCTNKGDMKRAMVRQGIHVAKFIQAEQLHDQDLLLKSLGLPMVLKKQSGMGSRGTRILRKAEQIPAQIPNCMMVEAFVDGSEMSIESLVQNGKIIFTNITEYVVTKWANICPAVLPTETVQRIKQLNRKAIQSLGIQNGICHMEFFITQEHLVFGELAHRPPGGHIMEMMSLAYGVNLWKLWIQVETQTLYERPKLQKNAAGMWLFHPGRGRIEAIEGAAEIRAMGEDVQLTLIKKVGAKMTKRMGVGEEAGHVLAVGPDRSNVLLKLNRANSLLKFRMSKA